MRERPSGRKTRSLAAPLLAILVATGVFGSGIVAPSPAQAQLIVSDPGATAAGTVSAAANTTTASAQVKQSAWDVLKIALTNTAELAILNGANYFAQKVAYDTANYVASGGNGQTPFFHTEGVLDYLGSTAKDAAADVLGTLSKDPNTFGKYGFNLCAPSDPHVSLIIKTGFLNGLPGLLGGSTGGPKPSCSWDTISRNWDQFSHLDSDTVLNNVGVMFTPGQSSLSAAIQVNNAALAEISKKQEAAVNDFVANNGFISKVSKIGGKVLTPADTIKTQLNLSLENGWKQGDQTVAISNGAFGNAAFGILPAALHTFTNTLAESMMKKVFDRGLITLNDILGNNKGDTALTFDGGSSPGGRASAELSNASLLTPKILSITNYNALTDFAACPAGSQRGPDNCVMDGQFFTAVNRASQGSPLTVRQAVAQGLLKANWPLLPLAHGKNHESTCYNEAFCYSNLVKLRKASVLPIGWELAANSPFNDVSRPITLAEAMNRFDDCPTKPDGSVDASKLPDPLHPWCHLIDPEWVLKYPVQICRQQAPGPTLVSSESPARALTCVDQATCIAQDAAGNCVGGYGYCVREKNVWNLDADACPAAYASCTTFRRADGASASYLSTTLDSGSCNGQNAGCRQYSQSQNAVPNGGFEDLLDGKARDWTLSPGARLSRSGLLAERGLDAVGLANGAVASVVIPSLQPSSPYVLSASVLQEFEASAPVGTVTLKLFRADGSPVSATDLKTTCTYRQGDPSVSLDISATHLGYLSGSCSITLPNDAASGKIELSSTTAQSGNRAWFDDVGLYGASFSASPYDSLLLNGKVQKCASDQAGCTDLVRMSTGTLNLVRDPSFETPDSSGNPKYWSVPTPGTYEKGTFKGFDGVSAMRLDANGVSQDVTGVLASASYVFSAYTKLGGAVSGNPRALVQLYDTSTPPAPVAPTSVTGCQVSGTGIRLDLAAGSDYRRAACAFTTPTDVGYARVTLIADNGSSALVDAVQLELSVEPTGYHEAYPSTAQHVYLKTMPEGLDCAGPDRAPECANYAPSCRREEVGCDSYKPDDGGIAIPAVTTAGDACPTECVGYDTFKEEPSNFNDPRFPLFLVPSTAQSCSAAEAGCSEFTNVQKLANGGESREDFSYLRLCAKPDQNAGTFYTWEGNDSKGYQLRTWTLLKSRIASSPVGGSDPTGGNAPCTKLAYDNAGRPACADDAASVAAASCLKSDLLANPDCREFYDAAGDIHYRLYSKTVVVSDACTEYRITKSTETECGAHGGSWRNQECHYFAYAPESQSCRAAAVGCRAYSGNASRNVRVALAADFESGTTGGWVSAPGGGATTDVANSNESVAAGGHSLKVSRATVTKDVSSIVKKGKSYLLTFWAKGTGDLTIAFSSAGDRAFTFNRVTGQPAPVALGTEWKPYQVGPVSAVNAAAFSAAGAAGNEQLTVSRSGSGSPLFYLDNIELREVTDDLYLIRDSWQTPASCDRTPSGDSSPQYMLGCRGYRDRSSRSVALKSFDRICRPEAVGCEAMYDTRHTASPFPQTFGAVCSLGAACAPSAGAVTCPCKIAGQTVCEAASGASTCRYDIDDSVPASRVSPSGDTVRIPADGVTYLVNDARYACTSDNVGCTMMGDKTLNRERTAVQGWKTVYFKNDPATYADTLCRKTEEYCQAYTRGADGSSAYFKDPELRTCEFKENVAGYSGWFKTGTSDPCYADYLQAGTQYGIWKNSDAPYAAWAGQCEPQYDQCKEFVDPQDTSTLHPNGQPYYAIKNARLDSSSCQNRASLTKSPSGADSASACVLFWQTDDLLKTFDAAATYQASDAQRGGLVSAVSSDRNDANVVLKVARDRQCGEWLDCRSSETVFNQTSGQYQNVCTSFGLCAQYERVGNTTRCVRYVDSAYTGQTLSTKIYQARDTGWKGLEYTSYAIPNQYPVNELVTMDVSSGTRSSKPDLRLVRVRGACAGAYGSACGPSDDPGTCLGPSNARKCVYPIDDGLKVTAESQLKQSQAAAGYPGTSCRAYPSENAPFPSTVADPSGWNLQAASMNNGNPVLIGPSPAFAAANVCQRRLVNGVEVSSCECNYTIAKYGSTTKYFPSGSSDIPTGYCGSGAYEGYECDPLASGVRAPSNLSCCSKSTNGNAFGGLLNGGTGGCDDGAQCIRLSKVDRVVGYEGQCLERDFTTPVNGLNNEYACLTWRPVGLVGGSRDIYNQNQTAGYFAAADRRFYCVGSQPAWSLDFHINTNEDRDQTDNHDLYYQYKGVGPYDQYTNSYFGHGTVTNIGTHSASQHHDCGDDTPNGGWCVWPTDSRLQLKEQRDGNGNVVTCTGNSDCDTGNKYWCSSQDPYKNTCVKGDTGSASQDQFKDYTFDNNAVGVLGCYEIRAGGTPETNYIDYPYIGPPLYRQQLQSIYFQVNRSIYHNFSDTDLAAATNPHQQVNQNCSDADDPSIASNADNDHADQNPTTKDVTRLKFKNGQPERKDGLLIPANNADHGLNIYYLDESNGFKVDASSGNGILLFTGNFDSNGKLSSIRIGAANPNGHGGSDDDRHVSFGIHAMGFVFKPGCSEIAQVDQDGEFGATQAFTNAINPARNFNPSAGGGLHADVLVNGDPNPAANSMLADYTNACTPFGAIGSISQPPPATPWTYVTSRLSNDVNQCTVSDFTKGNTYEPQAPETLAANPPVDSSGVQLVPPSSWASSSLRNLFRKIYDVWSYQPLDLEARGGTYQRVAANNPTGDPAGKGAYDETGQVDPNGLAFRTGLGSYLSNLAWNAPRIAAVDVNACDGNGRCKAGKLDSLTVNGRDRGVIIGADGAMSVTAKFFAWASHNSMPIVKRAVLWGDLASAEPPAKGWYKNQKPVCSPDVSDANAVGECANTPGLTCGADGDCPNGDRCVKGANNFGNTPGACNAAPYRFDHVYTCSLGDLQSMPLCTGSSESADNAPCYRLVNAAPVCVYRPKVQITDNWGWCNCTGSGCKASGGAYQDGCGVSAPPSDAKPWSEYAGEIRLSPSIKDAQAFHP